MYTICLVPGEAAYRSEVLVYHPHEISFIRVRSHHMDQSQKAMACIPQEFDREEHPDDDSTVDNKRVPMATVLCEVGHPLKAQLTAHFTMEFDRSHIIDRNLVHKELVIKAVARTGSTEVNPDDNVVEKHVPLEISTHLAIFGLVFIRVE